MFLGSSVVSSLVLVSHLLTLGSGDVAVGPASDTVMRDIIHLMSDPKGNS